MKSAKFLLASTMMLAAGLSAQQPVLTVQQQFDAATALSAGTDAAAALAAWQALGERTRKSPRTTAIVQVRTSKELYRLHRDDEALAAARSGLAGLPAGDKTLDGDRYDALMTIGQVNRAALDYAGAADAFARAVTFADVPADRMSATLSLAQVAIFTDPAAAEAALDRADALARTNKVSANVGAIIDQERALLLLNQGNAAAAVTPAKAAVTKLGGLTGRTDLLDVSARSTASLALLLSGNKDSAREYMAMTGAGRLSSGTFDPAVQMRVPDCGGEEGLKPDDVAVIEFSVADDGSVQGVLPVYAAGGGRVALEFARAARGWSWTPEQVKQLPPFFRYNTHVEMRCSTGFERPAVSKLIGDDLARWLESRGAPLAERSEAGDAASIAGQRAALARAEGAGSASVQALAALWTLANNAVVGREERNALARRALTIATAEHAPPMARLAIDVAARQSDKVQGRDSDTRALRPLLDDPGYGTDPQARAALRLLLAESLGRRHDEEQRALFQQVAGDPALAPDDRFRVGALVRLASLEQQAGHTEVARAAFQKTGLSADQCSIIDAPPRFLGAGGTFPAEAQRWGFEGWTKTQYDIKADGRVTNTRAILSYPPFVFTEAGKATMAGARYAKSYRPDGGLGCAGSSGRVTFRMPG